jgi:hypothetical protein
MVIELNELLKDLKNKHGNVYLFAILQMDEYVDKWTIILSAPWINTSASHQVIFEEIRDFLNKNLDKDELSSIARLSIMPKEEHLASELLKFAKGAEIGEQRVNGNMVYKGYILESDTNATNS